ncbi:MAG: glycosyltransferase [Oscillospiraceae bacterium]|nr:glycosyltransferase [Oscillospiraceae bacterium]
MKKAAVIGHFGFGLECLDGQTVKTKIVTEALAGELGDESVLHYDTHGGAKTLLKAPFMVLSALAKAQNVIILPAHNGLRVFGRLLPLCKRFFKGRKLHYSVVGGWLPEKLKEDPGLARALKKFDAIYAETNTVKNALEAQGFTNIRVMPNCKALTPLLPEDLVYQKDVPYKLCTFSRVMEEKGIGDAVAAVKAVNEQAGKTLYTLDIYGQVDPGQTQWFEKLQAEFPACVRYGGAVPFQKSVEVLKDYFALLFPTRYFTEGVPGTIIDAYASGVPVVSAKWESFGDIVDDGLTGIGYEFGSKEALERVLLAIGKDPGAFNALKENCLEKSKCFAPKTAIQAVIRELA